jgi:hypothetical protein
VCSVIQFCQDFESIFCSCFRCRESLLLRIWRQNVPPKNRYDVTSKKDGDRCNHIDGNLKCGTKCCTFFPVAILLTFTSVTNQTFGQAGCSHRCDVTVDKAIYSDILCLILHVSACMTIIRYYTIIKTLRGRLIATG